MRRSPLAVFALALRITPPAADAGVGSLLQAAAKMGSVGAMSAKVAKGGAMLKGASLLGATVAAERVFLHAPEVALVEVEDDADEIYAARKRSA